MAARLHSTLCCTCRELNLRPDTFLETGWEYPTSLQYGTIWDNHDNEADARPHRKNFDNVDGEEVNDDDDVVDYDSLDQRVPATPLKNVLNKEGDNEVPHKYRGLGSLGGIRQRAKAGCSLCQAIAHASRLAEARTAGLKLADTSQCLLRFDFKDIEAAAESVDGTELPSKSESFSDEITRAWISEASVTAQENGYYECTLNIGTEPPISIYPIFDQGKSDFVWFGGRLIEPEIDYELVKKWLSSCDTLHPACSEEKQKIDVSLVERLRVIDVLHGCLTTINVPPLFTYSNEMKLLVVLETLPDVVNLCIWSTRLWTLQEALMSRRLLLFTGQGMHFTCSSLRWSENLKALSETQPPPWKHVQEQMYDFRARLTVRDDVSTHKVDHIWHMEQWMTMVAESSPRQLGFEWDIENATAGMIAQLEAFYQTRNLYGLPECMLEESLSWSPMKFGSLRRRKNAADDPIHPSWSWSGWVGEIDWLVGAQDIIDTREDAETQVSIAKLSKLDAAPVPLASRSLDATRTPQETFPYLHILTKLTTLCVSKRVESPEIFRELVSFVWGVRSVQNEIGIGIYPVSTTQNPSVLVGSLIFDSTDFCREDKTFNCQFLQIYSKPQKHGYGKHANQAFYNVLAIKEVRVLDSGIPLVERMGHGRILLSETQGMWIRQTVVLQWRSFEVVVG